MTSPEPLHLPEGQVAIWWAHARPRSAGLLGLLDPIESTRLAALPRAGDRDRFASAHILTRLVLAAYLYAYTDDLLLRATCRICGAQGHGKPGFHTLDDPQYHYSLAYAGARVGVAVARVPVGLDVVVMTDDRPHPAAVTWARTESLLKATGHGLAVSPDDVRVTGPDDEPALLDWAEGPDPKDVQLADLAPGAGHVAALAVLTADTIDPERNLPLRVTEHDGEPLIAAAEPPSIA
ncbi:4'-phosphopantetheinyl transferase superfamily protein [Sporichthya polymorpha]|uniref:4'-phosphopantetheinyl transferase superfamily protein n=1 Tax=Sporichthya polymorpha TaxID=35751 RepID=UPI000368088C|nr:4'-phosphopantetheinyl transferase superfamily protein [Sporichthya polymorpha]